MSGSIPESKQFVNQLDNTDLVMDRSVKDIAAAYTAFDEVRAYREYLETLKLEQEMQGSAKKIKVYVPKPDGTRDEQEIEVGKLIPKPSAFESARRAVLAKLHNMNDIQIKQLLSDFETDSMWELSSKIANHVIDKNRRDEVTTKFKLY